MSLSRLNFQKSCFGALGAAMSMVFLSDLKNRQVGECCSKKNKGKNTFDEESSSSIFYATRTQWNVNRTTLPLLQPTVSYSEPSMSSSSNDMNTSSSTSRTNSNSWRHRMMARLVRRRDTVRMMEDTSSEKSLKECYNIDWKHPIGEGAFGTVYEATDKDTGEVVAMKQITKEYTDHAGFQREMHALHHIRQAGGHPNICRLRENFDQGPYYYLVLDLVSGGELFDHLVRLGSYSEADAARLVREVASALAFLHGIDTVHGDLKPENLMLSTAQASDAVIKLVDFGTSQVRDRKNSTVNNFGNRVPGVGNTIAYCPPEVLGKKKKKPKYMDPSLDMWSLGVIVYIMLTGVHPFDLNGQSTDEQIMNRILKHEKPPMRGDPRMAHLSDSAMNLIEGLLNWDSKKRLTASQMLEHPWVRGETARQNKMADSSQKLKAFRPFQSRIEATVFSNIVSWASDDGDAVQNDVSKKASLIERAFHSLDTQHKGFITTTDLDNLPNNHGGKKLWRKRAAASDSSLTLSNFEDLLSNNMKNKYFPKGSIIYREGDVGHDMYFIISGKIEVSTKEGSRSERTQGDFFGEGALLRQSKIRSGTIKCLTPVHVIQVSREYFEKYLASSEPGLTMTLREKDKARRRNRAKTVLSLQNNLKPLTVKKGDLLYDVGEEGNELYILEEGVVDVRVEGHPVFTIRQPGNMCGEHALLTGRLRNTAAACVSDRCKMQVMKGRDFHYLLKRSPNLKESLRDICLQREFLKALVFKTKKPFPSDPSELKEAFDAADEDSSGKISLENVRTMLKRYDPSIADQDLVDTINSLDLDKSGAVSFEEFKRIFGAHKKSMQA